MTNQTRRRKRRKKRMLKLLRLIVILVLLLIVLYYLIVNELKVDIIKGKEKQNKENVVNYLGNDDGNNIDDNGLITVHSDISQYPYRVPREYSETEIKSELENLSGAYPEFREILNNLDSYPKSLLMALCNNLDMVDFVNGYLAADTITAGELTEQDLNRHIPSLLQWDKRWGYIQYGDNNIALSGCAPTCLSMVVVGLTNNLEITPAYVAQFAMENDYYLEGTGTKWSIMTEGCLELGIRSRVVSLDETAIKNELENGHPVICSMGPGEFTTGGHFIVLSGVIDGKIVVNDPNSISRSNMLWDFNELSSQIKNIWSFQKK